MRRIRRQRVMNPAEAPDVEENVEVIDRPRAEDEHHRPGHHRGQADEHGPGAEPPRPRARRYGGFDFRRHHEYPGDTRPQRTVMESAAPTPSTARTPMRPPTRRAAAPPASDPPAAR